MRILRLAKLSVEKSALGYPVVAVTGPRQSGKTTLVRALFPKRPYVSLENLDDLDFATTDPRGFLGQFPDGAVLDEVQRAPQLFSYLQGHVDGDGRMGLFVLTGSQQFGLHEKITQSLAGRVAMVQLLPFAYAELRDAGQAPTTVDDLLLRGLYPPPYDRDLDSGMWFGNYVATYVERDVRQIVNIRDLGKFQRFLRLCAARTGQLLNLSSLANDCGITHNTAQSWIAVLEASFLVHRLEPHHRNFKKRLIKTPKLYFLDPGLAAWLMGIQTPTQLRQHPQRGALFETWVVTELIKMRFNAGLRSNLFFWRDRSGQEVDALAEQGAELIPIEVKSGQTLTRDFFRGLERFRDLAAEAAGRPWLLYGGDRRQRRTDVEVVPWDRVDDLAAAVLPPREDGPAPIRSA
ncbi:MAG: ATP-binding protein [Acidobacteriota bacterium]